jgi:M6 family metalloprotease-like protein
MNRAIQHQLGYVLLCVCLLFCKANQAWAIDANPNTYTIQQPDGTPVGLRIRGDEWFHHEEDLNGYTVIKDRNWYVYARRDQATGRLVSSGLLAGIDNPAANGLKPGELPSKSVRNERAQNLGWPSAAPGNQQDGGTSASSVAAASGGVLKNLVVLIRWADHTSRTLPTSADVDVLMNNAGPHPTLAPTGSLKDVYLENSYGALSIESTVAEWVTSDQTEQYYANGQSGLTSLTHDAIRDALTKVDQFINFSDFDVDSNGVIDCITFLHSGYGAEWGGTDAFGTYYTDRMWSHKWSISGGWTSNEGVTVGAYHISPAVWGTSGSSIGRVGVIAHETGHFLGLPDLYDTDSSPGNGIGSFGLMANSWGFDGSQKYPPHMCPWSKVQLGWLSPTVIDTAGTYTIQQTETSSAAYRIDLGYPSQEYLLIENRQPVGFDGAMPQGGLAIWHIDEQSSHNTEGYPSNGGWTGTHYRVALLQADGNYNLEKGNNRGDAYDTWHASGHNEITISDAPLTGPFPNTDAYQGNVFAQTNNRIYDISSAGSTMTFSFAIVGEASDPPAAPTGLAAVAVSHEEIQLTWIDQAFDETAYRVERSSNGIDFIEIASLASNEISHNDTGLSPETLYWYRVYAINGAGSSGYSNLASATTTPPPPPPAAPTGLIATPTSDEAISLSWIDNAADETEYRVHRSLTGSGIWASIATLPQNTAGFVDSGLSPSTDYSYEVTAFNAWGESSSGIVSATTQSAPAFADTFANQDLAVSGTVSGTYLLTHVTDGVSQIITEIESGGKPSKRRSFLEHQWNFQNVRGGLAITLFVNAWAPDNSEGDHFTLEYSADAGSNWSPLLTIPAGSTPDTLYSAELPGNDPANILIRVVDTDSTQGNRSLDSFHVDSLYLRTDLDPKDTPPTPPANLIAAAVSASEVQLIWDDLSNNERGFRVWRSSDGITFTEIDTAPVDATSYLDRTASPNTTYVYQVEAYTASFTGVSNTASATTPDAIVLSASGYKRKGKANIDLIWSGGAGISSVEIWRSLDGGAFINLGTVSHEPSGTSYTDTTDLKGSFILDYEVRSTGGPLISNTVTVVF